MRRITIIIDDGAAADDVVRAIASVCRGQTPYQMPIFRYGPDEVIKSCVIDHVKDLREGTAE